MIEERQGRGRLSSLDLVPEEALDDILWAMGELNERRRTQADILFELNDRLAVKGVEPISKSAFNRRAVRTASASARLAERRALFEGLAPQFTGDKIDDVNKVLGELIKTLIAEMLDAPSSKFDTKGVMELSRAFELTVKGQTISAEAKRRWFDTAAKQVKGAIDKVAAERGITAETRDRIMEQLGVIRKEPS